MAVRSDDHTKIMSDTEVDPEALQEQLDQIKGAMGLEERYPYVVRTWLTSGVTAGVILPLIDLGEYFDFSVYWYVALLGTMLLFTWATSNWAHEETGRFTAGAKPGWWIWIATLLAGTLTLGIGLAPVIDRSGIEDITVMTTIVTAVSGITYVMVGAMLKGYRIRKVDRYAFYTAGVWSLALAAVLLNVPFLRQWALTAVGVSFAVHGIGSYVVLSRV